MLLRQINTGLVGIKKSQSATGYEEGGWVAFQRLSIWTFIGIICTYTHRLFTNLKILPLKISYGRCSFISVLFQPLTARRPLDFFLIFFWASSRNYWFYISVVRIGPQAAQISWSLHDIQWEIAEVLGFYGSGQLSVENPPLPLFIALMRLPVRDWVWLRQFFEKLGWRQLRKRA